MELSLLLLQDTQCLGLSSKVKVGKKKLSTTKLNRIKLFLELHKLTLYYQQDIMYKKSLNKMKLY